MEFWYIPELLAHLEDDLYYYIAHSFLLPRNDSIRKNILPQTQ